MTTSKTKGSTILKISRELNKIKKNELNKIKISLVVYLFHNVF